MSKVTPGPSLSVVETEEGRSPSHQSVLRLLKDRGALAVGFA